jgi:hypothetical protein
MYSSVCAGVKRAAIAALALWPLVLHAQADAVECDPALARLWTPARPVMGRYEVCTTRRPLADLLQPGWVTETVAPLDAFGSSGTFNRALVARLYRGVQPTVARGWIEENGRFSAITLVSPHPNRQMTALEPGTLVIRYFVFE